MGPHLGEIGLPGIVQARTVVVKKGLKIRSVNYRFNYTWRLTTVEKFCER